ncbi:hypothetical protein SPRG_17486 [Saprolegnia parasitica CBS 223.65]|uniref:Peptide N-acetyl-beta-D-glucosaminyl asparaginase amidase A N-terminal domain-containing protein n=1 Tax=Saprolegnia parasitica (strain CBS 223.65) TaxID=695850 RepID=A0A067BS33_SAPPC|nr:hypothetical protein SPRG_17486 [Saprolegnia parasitica CBS 223.65]KDO17101.1 hypothetical protein SPRG_17486 [Saprolegnia parasitica CBS 223.65]|eukprot:XP_012212191.1 hypothetical protein SPRG_17486 [Saprolegnia parasitica CBS 223.65]
MLLRLATLTAVALAADNIASIDVTLPVNTNQVHDDTPACKVVLMDNHVFGHSYGKPFQGAFPIPACASDPANSVVYLRWSASVPAGRQFDRIAAVWANGYELLRTTTQEPSRKTGATWEVLKDVSHYKDVLAVGGNVVVALDNVVDQTYTSSFTVSVTAEFYKPKDACGSEIRSAPLKPDNVLSISNKNGAYGWFHVQPSTSSGGLVTLPRNLDQLFLEVFTSHHGCDEFYYTNPPNEYKEPLQTNCGNGAFREFQILVDGKLVSTFWPFPLIYTGGISPYMWRPVVATGAFEAPTYLVDLTPFLGIFVDGKAHNVSFSVGHGLDYWPTSGNLLVYLDKAGNQTQAVVQSQTIPVAVAPKVVADVHGLDMTIKTTATRQNAISTRITTSRGTKLYSVASSYTFYNDQVYTNNASTQWFDQRTTVTTTTTITSSGAPAFKRVTKEVYPFTGNTTYVTYSTEAVGASVLPAFRRNNHPEALTAAGFRLNTTVDHAFIKTTSTIGDASASRLGLSDAAVAIRQQADAYMDSLVGGSGNHVAYLAASNATGCYSHDVAASVVGGYLKDVQGTSCPAL